MSGRLMRSSLTRAFLRQMVSHRWLSTYTVGRPGPGRMILACSGPSCWLRLVMPYYVLTCVEVGDVALLLPTQSWVTWVGRTFRMFCTVSITLYSIIWSMAIVWLLSAGVMVAL